MAVPTLPARSVALPVTVNVPTPLGWPPEVVSVAGPARPLVASLAETVAVGTAPRV